MAKTKRIMLVFGTRPEAIKMAPLIQELKSSKSCSIHVCVTGQHRQMLDQVLELFNIRPDTDLNIMEPGQDLTGITCRVLAGMRDVIASWRPDWIVVQGDTTTTMGASLAAFYQKISVAHVEAGLRTGNIYSPWPEEINRRVAGAIALLHFPPTEQCAANLKKEGVNPDRIHVTGNTVIDALLGTVQRIRTEQKLRKDLEQQFSFLNPARKLILVTGHRRESFGKGIEHLGKALRRLSERNDIELLYPVHLNPNVQEPIKRLLHDSPSVHLIDPLDYLPFVYAMDRSYLIITDSGGVQEEAPSLGKPVLVTRETTERPEGVTAGTSLLVGTDENRIVAEAERLLDSETEYKRRSGIHNPYGDGHASERIAEILMAS